MTKGGIIFGLAVGGTLGLFVPKIFTPDLGVANLIAAVIGAILGLVGVGAYVNWFGRIR